MSRTSWNNLSVGQKVAITIGISAGAAVLYVCYTRYRGERALKKLVPSGENLKLRLKVPQDALKLLVGKDGAIKKRLRKLTDAHIEVSRSPDSKGEYEVTITGSPAQVYQAKEAVHGIVQNVALRVELQLPTRCMPRIIGQGGERIRAICKSSGAKIQCEQNHGDGDVVQTRRIIVTGTKEQVETAKMLIQKVSEEEENLQQRAAKSSAFRCRRKEIIAVKKKIGQEASGDWTTGQNDQKHSQDKEVAGMRSNMSQEQRKLSQENITDATYNVSRFEVPSPDFTFCADEYVNVYVSATENPQHFWIQILGSRSSQLDKLTTEMTEHYQKQKGSGADIQVGDIVAAPFHTGQFWYRAEVLGFLENGNVDLYYVDYGDNWVTAVENVFPLRSDFLSLPFQAIECSLVGIAPVGGQWSNTALDVFDSLTYCAQWKPLLAKISSFPSPGVAPCFLVRLYDPSTEPIVDIGQQLINQGFAVEHKDNPLQADAEESLVSRLMDEVSNISMGQESFSFSSHQEHLLASYGSIEMMRSDEKLVEESGMLCQHGATSTPVSCAKDEQEKERKLVECISKIKISYNKHSAQVESPETIQPLACNASVPLEPPVNKESFPVERSGCDVTVIIQSSGHKASPTVKTSKLEANLFKEQAGHDPSSALETSENDTSSLDKSTGSVREHHSHNTSSTMDSSACEASSALESSVFNTSSSTESASYVESTCSSVSGEQSFTSTSLDDSSICSPRGCFYYMTDEMSTSSIINGSSCDIITISSDSEVEAGGNAGKQKTAKVSEVPLTSESDDDVILVEDRP